MTTAISIVDAAYNEVNARSTSIEKLLPPHMKLERFMMQVKIAIYKVPGLAKCDPKSLNKSFLECAELGLDPTFRLGSACIVPFAGVATLIIGYRGMIDLATRSGEVKSAPLLPAKTKSPLP